jgi:ferredoxin
MPDVILNDETYDVEPGQVLLDVARKHAAHIGFICDGNGLCQMCECRVVSGAEHLSPPNEAEKTWLTQEQLDEGRRLCCQTSLRGRGPVTVITRAEELRRQADAIFQPPNGTDPLTNLTEFVQTLVKINVEHIRMFPANTIYAMTHFWSVEATFNTEMTFLSDSWNITKQLLFGDSSKKE